MKQWPQFIQKKYKKPDVSISLYGLDKPVGFNTPVLKPKPIPVKVNLPEGGKLKKKGNTEHWTDAYDINMYENNY